MFRAQLLGSHGLCSVFMLALFGFCAIASEASSQASGTVTQPLVQADGPWWTENGRHIPMCWHFFSQFPTTSDRDDAKTFVVQTIQDSWISLLDLSTSWADCPTSGNGKHVRVMLRIGDPSSNGTTLKAGTKTLSTAVERLVPPPNDPPGLLMGFPSNWNQSDATRSNFRALIRHEFGIF